MLNQSQKFLFELQIGVDFEHYLHELWNCCEVYDHKIFALHNFGENELQKLNDLVVQSEVVFGVKVLH
jgi:hypothetical protein